MPSSAPNVDNYPSLLWISLPPALLLSAYYIRKWYLARRLRLYGIGKGAAGFQTNVKRVRVTPEIAARIRRGEEVSPAEIEAASRAADAREAEEEARAKGNGNGKTPSSLSNSGSQTLPRGVIEERDDRHLIGKDDSAQEDVVDSFNEWLPESITKPSKRRKGRK